MKLRNYFFLLLICKEIICFRRVSHGKRPPSYDYPYLTQVLLEGKMRCTGTILNEWTVLTTGKCVDGANGIKITLGTYEEKVSPKLGIDAKKWYSHPDYKEKGVDLGLVITGTEFVLFKNLSKFNNRPNLWLPPVSQDRWLTDPKVAQNLTRPMSMCGFGDDEKSVKNGLRCLNYTKTDQDCLKDGTDHKDFEWCFYSTAEQGGDTQRACEMDDGAGIFVHTFGKWGWDLYKLFAVYTGGSNCKDGTGVAKGIHLTPELAKWVGTEMNRTFTRRMIHKKPF